MMNISMIGWVATAAFAISYFFRRPATLRKIQAFAACLWIMYGIAIGALPVIVVLMIVGAIVNPVFFTSSNLINVAEGGSALGMVVVAETLILLTGKFDISLQGTKVSRDGVWVAYALTPQDGDGELVVRNVQVQPALRHVELDHVAVLH